MLQLAIRLLLRCVLAGVAVIVVYVVLFFLWEILAIQDGIPLFFVTGILAVLILLMPAIAIRLSRAIAIARGVMPSETGSKRLARKSLMENTNGTSCQTSDSRKPGAARESASDDPRDVPDLLWDRWVDG